MTRRCDHRSKVALTVTCVGPVLLSLWRRGECTLVTITMMCRAGAFGIDTPLVQSLLSATESWLSARHVVAQRARRSNAGRWHMCYGRGGGSSSSCPCSAWHCCCGRRGTCCYLSTIVNGSRCRSSIYRGQEISSEETAAAVCEGSTGASAQAVRFYLCFSLQGVMYSRCCGRFSNVNGLCGIVLC